MSALNLEDIKKLRAKFDDTRLGVKIQSLSKSKDRAMLVLYLQHTDVADRLEEVDPAWTFSVLNEWQVGQAYFAKASITLKGVTRENVGEGEDPKSAYSDALKRCAMLFGVGRYLYDSEQVWVPYDEQRDRYKQWTPEEYWKWVKPEPRPKAVAKSTASVKPRGTIAPEAEPEASDKPEETKGQVREKLNRQLMALYRPYLTKFPQANFQELLLGRYNVAETRLATVEQLEDLVVLMQKQLNDEPLGPKATPRASSFGGQNGF